MPEHSYRIYNKARAMGIPAQIYYHQDGHGGPPPVEMMNRWFTKYLFEIDNGVENDAKAWIVRERDSQDQPTAYTDFPNPSAESVILFLQKGGNDAGTLSSKRSSKEKESLIDNANYSGEYLARAKSSNHRLLYTTPILSQDLHLSGTVSIEIKMASSKPAANLSVWLVALPWEYHKNTEIYDNIITRGWADPQNSKSLTESKPLDPGNFYTLNFDLQPDDQIIPAGQQIGLMIFSSDQEFTLHPEPGTVLTLDLKETKIILPIVGGVSALRKALE
jgi:X-Pro dipeptidyl-peptidase